ncbi:MAG: MFS transporter [Candidatus Margulisiibacteriota bacterium]
MMSKANIEKWDVEDAGFWESTGKKVARLNLLISIPSLLCGFAVWMMWSIITVQMLNLGFAFDPDPAKNKAMLFTLMAIAGFAGATLRIPSTFFIRLAGGRNTIFFTTALLIIPALGTGLALQNLSTPLWTFQILALLSGLGGGNFASSMSNISFFFPKKVQGTSLGLNAGLGNFGVTTMQILIPISMTFALLGPLSGKSATLIKDSGTLIGKIPAGTETWLQNAGFVWLLLLIPLVILAFFKMNNIKTETVSPNIKGLGSSISKIILLLSIGFLTTAIGLYFILPPPFGLPDSSGLTHLFKNKWLVMPAIIALTIFLMKLVPGEIKASLDRQYKIFGNKHTWAMTIIYTMTFGSFIGYSAAFPLAITVIFGFVHTVGSDGIWLHDVVNAHAPNALMYAWMGAFIGAIVRPIGGWISDKVGGAKVTQVVSIVMTALALGVAYYMTVAYHSATPEIYFKPFFILFILLFMASGIGNGSTFRTIGVAFDKEQAGPVLGWTSAVAAYGAFIIPIVFGEQIKAGTPQFALYGFALFYAVCMVINYWFYMRPNAYIKNP